MEVVLRYNAASVQVIKRYTGEILYQGSGLVGVLQWLKDNDAVTTRIIYPKIVHTPKMRLGAHRHL